MSLQLFYVSALLLSQKAKKLSPAQLWTKPPIPLPLQGARVCFGQGRSVWGEVMMLEHCGSAGHVWKILNVASFEEVEPVDDDPEAQQSVRSLGVLPGLVSFHLLVWGWFCLWWSTTILEAPESVHSLVVLPGQASFHLLVKGWFFYGGRRRSPRPRNRYTI